MTGDQPRPCCFEVFTLFPGAIDGFVGAGLLGKAIERGRVQVRCTDFRRFATDRHRTVDDTPFGGGAGMVMTPGPVVEAMEHVAAERGAFHRVLLTPSAPRFDQRVAARLAKHERIGLLCGRYEGIDDRVRENFVDECLSLGDFVLGGGEVAALVIIEAISRLIDGVVGNPQSVHADSFGREGESAVLEHPHYTRPAQFRGHAVPPVLLAGNHEAIARWRHEQALGRTWALRPDLRVSRRLGPEHPIYLAVPPSARANAAQLTAVARDHGVAGLIVVGEDPDQLPAWLAATEGRASVAVLPDGKALRRRFRRGAAGPAHFVALASGVDPGYPAAPCTHVEHLLDLLSEDAGDRPLGPLVLWLGGPRPPGVPFHAIYAPKADDLTSGPALAVAQGLARRGAIAQSPEPVPGTATLADLALTQLRKPG